MTPGVLGRDLDLSSGAMNEQARRIERAGYIRRLADPADRRGVRVGLTDEGRVR